jgi:MoxR-like ATPase
MALAASLLPGFKYEIKDGDFAGEIVTIKDNKAFPDGHPQQRKITVLTPEGTEYFILPRQLRDTPVGMAEVETAAPVAAPVALVTPIAEPVLASLTQPDGTQVINTVRTIDPITDPMDARLDHLRPSRRKFKQYIGRDMGNGMSDTDFLLAFTTDVYRADANNAGRPASILLKGDTQSGKTMLVEVLAILWADALGLPKPMPIFTISGSSGVTDFDLFGQTTSYTDPQTGRESLVWLPGMVELAAQVGGILYLDEVNALDPRVTSSLHPLTDHRHLFVNRNKAIYRGGQFMPEVTQASLDLWIIGTYNESYAGMGKLNEAFVNRFEHVVWGYHGDVESKLIKSAAIRLLGDALRTARERNSIRTPVGTAALQRCERNVATFGPVLGLNVLTSQFGPQERPIVESIIEDRSIIILINEELRQAAAEAKDRS